MAVSSLLCNDSPQMGHDTIFTDLAVIVSLLLLDKVDVDAVLTVGLMMEPLLLFGEVLYGLTMTGLWLLLAVVV